MQVSVRLQRVHQSLGPNLRPRARFPDDENPATTTRRAADHHHRHAHLGLAACDTKNDRDMIGPTFELQTPTTHLYFKNDLLWQQSEKLVPPTRDRTCNGSRQQLFSLQWRRSSGMIPGTTTACHKCAWFRGRLFVGELCSLSQRG